jgi:cell division protein FtsX
MQATLVSRYPNVSVIDLREVLDTIQGIVDGVTLGVTVVGGLVLFSGMLILIGAVSMTKFQRVYEAAILKTLGASSRLVATMLLLEYGVLGAIAGTVGALGAIVLSWAVARYALDLTWHATSGHHAHRHHSDRHVCRGHWCSRQPRRSPSQTARDPASRVRPTLYGRAREGFSSPAKPVRIR